MIKQIPLSHRLYADPVLRSWPGLWVTPGFASQMPARRRSGLESNTARRESNLR